jgi:glycosyltransferase involved in cell wall biosynthesis
VATVLNVLYDERVGGPQRRVLQVAPQLRKRGLETVVVMPKGDPAFGSLLKQAQIPFHEIDLVRLRHTLNPLVHAGFLARFWPNVMALRRLIREHHIEAVHTNGLMNIQAAVAAHLESVPLVWGLNDVGTLKLLRLAIVPLVRSWAERIAIAADAVGQYYFPNPLALGERLHLLYAPVDIRRFGPHVDGSLVRGEFGIGDSSPVVGMVANIGPGKGIEYFLEAAATIKRRYPEAVFLLVGAKLDNRRRYWSALMRQTVRLGLGRDVIFTGWRNDVPQLLRSMTVYVHPSEAEACPMAVLEACASGLPVVATDVGGTRELVRDGVTGILIEPREPAEMADAVIRLLASREAARRMGLAGAEHMSKFFSLDACVEAHVRMYAGVLERADEVAVAESMLVPASGAFEQERSPD